MSRRRSWSRRKRVRGSWRRIKRRRRKRKRRRKRINSTYKEPTPKQ